MLGIVSMAGNALAAFGKAHPAIKWGVVILAGVLAVEFVGKEAISLYVAMQTARAQIEQTQETARQTKIQADAMSVNPYDPKFGNYTTLKCRAGIDDKSAGGSGYPYAQVPKDVPNPLPPGTQYPCP